MTINPLESDSELAILIPSRSKSHQGSFKSVMIFRSSLDLYSEHSSNMQDDKIMNHRQRNETPREKDVELTLTLRGGRDTIMTLLEKMNGIDGFAVLKGSFTVKVEDK